MKKAIVVGVGAVLLALGQAGCTDSSRNGAGSGPDHQPYGGTLRVGTQPLGVLLGFPGLAQYALDPQFEYFQDGTWELFRCCLLRTLLSYNGRPTAEGGAVLRPDLASSAPRVSPDGQTWTFHLRHGLHYAPPYQQSEITAGDIVRALEREFRLRNRGLFSFYYTVIQGTKEFAAGKANSIAGLEVPDPHTLVVHLTKPTGDLGYRFSLPPTAPIPPGADRGHDAGYGRYLVSSGPYMIAGSERMDFSLPPARQRPATGWVYHWTRRGGRPVLLAPESLTLVRNPSWRRVADPLRPAYADRIQVQMLSGNSALLRLVERDRLDVLLLGEADPAIVRRYEASESLRSRVHVDRQTEMDFVAINTAVPPLDDVHIRRALNFVVDRDALVRINNQHPYSTGIQFDAPATHAFPDSVENGLLADYEPYGAPRNHGNLARARAEIRKSRYDRNHDGRCDAQACKAVIALGTTSDAAPELRPQDTALAHAFRRLGINLVVRNGTYRAQVALLTNPRTHLGLYLHMGWYADYPDAASFAVVLQNPTESVNEDFALLGATRAQLRRWKYDVEQVPSVDSQIARCLGTVGGDRPTCWATLDQRLMETVVPWIPWGQATTARITSGRVSRYSYDPYGGFPALDRIALRPSPS